jgi:uncharacterized protein YqhQ
MSDAQERKRLQVGGQAVIEGVMMRSPTCIATAVRTPEGIVVKREPFTSLVKRHRLLGVPIVRGAVAFVETFVVAVKALSYSAEIASAEPGAAGAGKESAEAGPGPAGTAPAEGRRTARGKGLSALSIAATLAAAFLLGFAIFFYIPLVLTELTGLRGGVLFNLVDGVIRLAFLLVYIVLITRWKEMRRIFEYHGAEHKAIAAFEAHGAATLENTRAYPTTHARCSTSFLLLVVVVSVLVFMVLGRPDTIGEKLLRFAFIPVIGGVSYELLKLSARPGARRYFAPLVLPGLALQRLTTKEPDAGQVEVAIAALDACLSENPVAS